MPMHAFFPRQPSVLAAAVATLFMQSAQSHDFQRGQVNEKPRYITSDIRTTRYDGVTDDLLTGGLGLAGLLAPAAPPFANALAPTVAELRRNAIHTNYRALVDPTPTGGFGRLYGPNIDAGGNDTLGQGKVAGTESIAVAGGRGGRENVTLMVQVPASFDPARPCIVTATSSGSRGIYGAIGTSGDWGLKHGCAVAYTDKGSGNGFHDLMTNVVTRIDGRPADATVAGADALFVAPITDAERAAFNLAFPNRVAYKHAHSGLNPEAHWGRDTLRAVEFAFYVLNEQFGQASVARRDGGGKRVRITPEDTLVIASSVSNGAGAALAAAELDRDGLIDGVAVSEPNVYIGETPVRVTQGDEPVAAPGLSLIDYFTFANLYQPCAGLATAARSATSPLFWTAALDAAAVNRCTALRGKGLLASDTPDAQAAEALQRLRDYGWPGESDFLHLSHHRFATNSIVVTYVNAYGRFKPTDAVCGFTFANTNGAGDVVSQNPALQSGLFSTGNGVPPTSGINIVYNDSVGGARLDFLGVSPSTGLADMSLDGALCLRSLATGRDAVTGAELTGAARTQAARVRHGVHEIRRNANLRGRPALIVSGRNDTLIQVNAASRAYLARNAAVEGRDSGLRYVEVTAAQHFDAFLGLIGPVTLGYDTRFVPLHVYFNRALDAMWEHLRTGAPLPPSQVVRAVPRTASGQPVTDANLPAWSMAPAATEAIEVAPNRVRVPQ